MKEIKYQLLNSSDDDDLNSVNELNEIENIYYLKENKKHLVIRVVLICLLLLN